MILLIVLHQIRYVYTLLMEKYAYRYLFFIKFVLFVFNKSTYSTGLPFLKYRKKSIFLCDRFFFTQLKT